MHTEVMLDLETLGNRPGSVIVAIGAVKFGTGEIYDSFYQRVDAESCVAAGLTMEVQTIMWWLKQSDEARNEITLPGEPLRAALEKFASWLADPDAYVWGNGCSFDNAVLAAAYDQLRLPRPWRFSRDRCYRTASGLWPNVPFERLGTHHNALEDARTQANHLMKIQALRAQEAAAVP
jgi:DNA polymerase III epsilon subunit-like protein